ncbi:unnamed protein product [Leptidea sinapis]|uniref:Fibronectin type-III domain-containing protein n=1 Tax=Leptidea sinapis TaxID=189913 RepID=A0A5E4R2Y8_9NEOP|nr:unnamed protein product [Leptidea sinapis]
MPQDVKVDAFDKHTLRVTWKPPPPQDWNGELQGYYVGYKLASSNKSYVFETVDISKESGKEHHLDILNLKTYTQYAIVVQAFNKMGSGPVSNEVRAYTAEGAPSAPPQDVLCTTLTAQTIRVSWVSPPLAAANGLIKAYKVIYGPSETWYAAKPFSMDSRSLPITLWKCWRPPTEETDPSCRESPSYGRGLHLSVMAAARAAQWRRDALQRVHSGTKRRATSQQASQTSYSATELKAGRYDFWVTASTIIGEGQPSATASCSPSDKVPAKIASFDESFTATYKEDVKLPCLAVGVPQPNILLQNESANCRKVHCRSLVWRERTQGSTLVTLRTSSERTPSLTRCHATLPSATEHRVFICFISHAATQAARRRRPVLGRRLHHPLQTGIRRLGNCTDINSIIGTGEASDVVIARTRGSKPPVPRAADFIEVGSSSVTLHLKQWLDGGCPMSHFVVENKKKGAAEWNQISNAVKPGGNFVVLASHMVRAADHRSQ